MIKCTLKQLGEGQLALHSLLKEKLPLKAKYAISKLARACDSELEHFNQERAKLFTEAGCTVRLIGRDKEGNEKREWVHTDPDVVARVAKLIDDELVLTEVEINAMPLDLELFGNGETEGHFYALEWAIKEPKA
jgi:hypothetical protein